MTVQNNKKKKKSLIGVADYLNDVTVGIEYLVVPGKINHLYCTSGSTVDGDDLPINGRRRQRKNGRGNRGAHGTGAGRSVVDSAACGPARDRRAAAITAGATAMAEERRLRHVGSLCG